MSRTVFNGIGDFKYPYTSDQVGHRVDVDFINRGVPTPAHLIQFDEHLPYLIVYLTNNGTPYTITDDMDVRIRLTKRDGKVVYNPLREVTDESGTHVYGGRYHEEINGVDTIITNAVCVEITKEMTDLDGIDIAVIEIITHTANTDIYNVQSTCQFLIYVELNPVSNTSIVSTSQYKSLYELVKIVEQVADSFSWSEITDKPTTLEGFNITDAYTREETMGLLDLAIDTAARTVEGNSNDKDGVWTGTVDGGLRYKDGVSIIYTPKVSPGYGNTTLRIGNLEPKPIYILKSNGTSVSLTVDTYGGIVGVTKLYLVYSTTDQRWYGSIIPGFGVATKSQIMNYSQIYESMLSSQLITGKDAKDIFARRSSTVSIVVGGNSDTDGVWTGYIDSLDSSLSDIKQLFDGLTILYKPTANPGSASTTLSINGYTAYPIYIYGSGAGTTNLVAGKYMSIINATWLLMRYSTSDGGKWYASYMYGTRPLTYNELKAANTGEENYPASSGAIRQYVADRTHIYEHFIQLTYDGREYYFTYVSKSSTAKTTIGGLPSRVILFQTIDHADHKNIPAFIQIGLPRGDARAKIYNMNLSTPAYEYVTIPAATTIDDTVREVK